MKLLGFKAYGESWFLDNATILVISRVDAARASRLLKLKFQCLKCRGNFVPLPVSRSTIKALSIKLLVIIKLL